MSPSESNVDYSSPDVKHSMTSQEDVQESSPVKLGQLSVESHSFDNYMKNKKLRP